jgi:hypothetical protein
MMRPLMYYRGGKVSDSARTLKLVGPAATGISHHLNRS